VIYRFADFTLDPAAFKLHQRGQPVPLSPKIFDLLVYLVARPAVLE
jgi:DNA-binding winged helix-turn-helix (wHTH) protein